MQHLHSSSLRRMNTLLLGTLILVGGLSQAKADDAETSFANELLECASYYQIATEAIDAVDAPQMQAVSKRLAAQAQHAQTLAVSYLSPKEIEQTMVEMRQAQQKTMKHEQDLRPLMQAYKEPCSQIMSDPQARLSYWQMATM